MHAEQDHYHHRGQRQVRHPCGSATAEKPIETSSEHHGGAKFPERRAEKSERFNRQILHVAERELVMARVRCEDVADVRPRWKGMRLSEDAHAHEKYKKAH